MTRSSEKLYAKPQRERFFGRRFQLGAVYTLAGLGVLVAVLGMVL